MDVAVFGGSEFTLGFMLAGIKQVFTIDETERNKEKKEGTGIRPANVEKMLDDLLTAKEIGIVVIDDHLLRQMDERTREKVERSVRPVFVPLSTEASQDTLRRMIIKSIGVDLMRE